MRDASSGNPLIFGNFVIDPGERLLLIDGKPAKIGARTFQLLTSLVERRGHVVSKDELLELVWPKSVVEENTLQVHISSLRRLLGPQAITTVPGRGYSLALELTPGSESPSLPAPPRHNLPSQLTSFIGHDDDLQECAALLEQTRLLTLTGIGGCGKTRLALQLAERVLASFSDGVWFVDLLPLADADRLALSVATAIGVRQRLDRPPIETLCEHLAQRRALVVLDNCEHLNSACAELAQRLLGAAPDLRVLVTSREGLGVPGERIVTVRSLGLPGPSQEHDLAGLESCEAVRLFVERARLAASKFAFNSVTAPAVANICRQLDGIPLAIELAAARVKVLSVEEIRTRLDDRFRLLTHGGGTALGRQQTLLAAIQWSYEHLSMDEQWLLRMLSVFVGGWTLAAAVRVIGDPADEYRVLDLLSGLVDRSLVIMERTDHDTTRYAMLETVRQYAQQRLNESREGDAARTRHAEFCVAFAEELGPEISGPMQRASLARLKAELENLLQAMRWCDHAAKGPEMGIRMARALRDFWPNAGLVELGYRQTVAALIRKGPSGQARAQVLMAVGTLSSNLNRLEEAKEHFVEALSIGRSMGDGALVASSLLMLGYLACERGDSAAALARVEEALAIVQDLQDRALLARTLNVKAEIYRAVGNMENARALYEQALALARAGDNLDLVTIICDNLARVFIPSGEPQRALSLVMEVLELARATGSKWRAICALDVTAGLIASAMDWEFAARMRGAAEARVKFSRYARGRADEAFLAEWTQRICEALGETAYRATFDSGFALSNEQALDEAFTWLAKSAGALTN